MLSSQLKQQGQKGHTKETSGQEVRGWLPKLYHAHKQGHEHLRAVRKRQAHMLFPSSQYSPKASVLTSGNAPRVTLIQLGASCTAWFLQPLPNLVVESPCLTCCCITVASVLETGWSEVD